MLGSIFAPNFICDLIFIQINSENAFIFISAGRRPIGPGLRVRRYRMTQYCQEPNGNSFSLNSSTEVK